MGKQMQITVDIPDGYDFVRYGSPMKGENYLCRDGAVCVAVDDFDPGVKYVIVRPAWVWPAVIKAPWIAMDENGLWYAYDGEPHVRGADEYQRQPATCWSCGNVRYTAIQQWAIDFTPPPTTDWKSSKRKNPNL